MGGKASKPVEGNFDVLQNDRAKREKIQMLITKNLVFVENALNKYYTMIEDLSIESESKIRDSLQMSNRAEIEKNILSKTPVGIYNDDIFPPNRIIQLKGAIGNVLKYYKVSKGKNKRIVDVESLKMIENASKIYLVKGEFSQIDILDETEFKECFKSSSTGNDYLPKVSKKKAIKVDKALFAKMKDSKFFEQGVSPGSLKFGELEFKQDDYFVFHDEGNSDKFSRIPSVLFEDMYKIKDYMNSIPATKNQSNVRNSRLKYETFNSPNDLNSSYN